MSSDNQSTSSKLIISDIPTDVLRLILPLLGRDLIPFASTCHTLQDASYTFVCLIIEGNFSHFPCRNGHFDAALYIYFLDYLKTEFPQMMGSSVSMEDLTGVCHLHSLKSEDLALIRAADLMRRLLGVDHNGIDLKQHVSNYSERAFQRSLFFTAEYLLKNALITPGDYYLNAAMISRNPDRLEFFKKALDFPFESFRDDLHYKFDGDFAMMVLKSDKFDDQVKDDVLRLASNKIDVAVSYSPELLLMIANSTYISSSFSFVTEADSIRAILSAVPESIICNVKASWRWKRYLFFMETFDEIEFRAKVPLSFDVVQFLPYLGLNRRCHFQAFVCLIRHERIQVPSYEGYEWYKNILYICAQSPVLDYWYLYCKYARAMPTLMLEDDFITKRVRLSLEMLASLSTRLTALQFWDFIAEEEWHALAHGFNNLDISKPIRVEWDTLPFWHMPTKWCEGRSWPLLHLALLSNHLLAFKAVLRHPQFSIAILKELVQGLTLLEWFDQMDVEGLCRNPYQRYSDPFRVALKARLEGHSF